MWILALISSLFGSAPAHAWDKHHVIMEGLGQTKAALNRRYLHDKIRVPNEDEERKTIHDLAIGLELREAAIPVFSQQNLGVKETEVFNLFRGNMIDEPDQGMDQDLLDTADPKGHRDWMGGRTGPTSQGFRHMYFPGVDPKRPVQTIQFPFHAVGQAPARFQKMIAMSDKFFKEGQKFWAVRLMIWGLHYLQDLHQPFHVLQIPYWRFLPLRDLFSNFVARATQSMANYHYAYEGIALTDLERQDDQFFRTCLEVDKPRVSQDLSEVIANAQREARDVGQSLYEVFGEQLKKPEIDLPNGIGKFNYNEVLSASRSEGKIKLRESTCRLYQSLAQFTWGQFDRAFDYSQETSVKSGR